MQDFHEAYTWGLEDDDDDGGDGDDLGIMTTMMVDDNYSIMKCLNEVSTGDGQRL